MSTRSRWVWVFALVAWPVLAGCEAVVGDFSAEPCDPDPPGSCADLGDTDDQRRGCCDGEAAAVYYCSDGALRTVDCGSGSCDYDPDRDVMACME